MEQVQEQAKVILEDERVVQPSSNMDASPQAQQQVSEPVQEKP